jgi:hypothetical protein
MKLRFVADRRALIWAFVLFPGVVLTPYVTPRAAGWLVPLSFCAGVFAHNHNHCPMFKGRTMNTLYSAWLSIFYRLSDVRLDSNTQCESPQIHQSSWGCDRHLALL